jgi:hypothetical protein
MIVLNYFLVGAGWDVCLSLARRFTLLEIAQEEGLTQLIRYMIFHNLCQQVAKCDF